MLTLYRFEVMAFDAAAMQPSRIGGFEAPRLPSTSYVTLLTNWERPVTVAVDPGAVVFLPSYSHSGQVWTFEPAEITEQGLRLDGEQGSGDLQVSLPHDHALAELFASEPKGYQLWLTVSTMENESATPLRCFTGMVVGTMFDEYRCTFTLQPLIKVLERQTLQALHPRDCPYSLFSQSTCRVKPNATALYTVAGVSRNYYKWREDGNISSLSEDGMVLTVPEAANRPNGFFDGGLGRVHA